MPARDGQGPLWWHGKFKGCGYRITLGRKAILNVLSATKKHLSAEDIYMQVHPHYSHIGLTTIYRTLDILANLGIVYKFDFGDGRARYELAEDPKTVHHHHHLICTACNRVIDYREFINEEVELLRQTEKGLAKKYDFKITNHLIQFYGLCKQCQKQNNSVKNPL
jgi:Fur family ferric uptake transcriptional regulator